MNLTIIIPTHDRNNSAVECALALGFSEAEIIVVDDGSAQPVVIPPGIARVLRHERHRGRAAALNTGLRAASHDLVLIIDDGLYAAADMVERMVDEYTMLNDNRVFLTGRVVWDRDVPRTLSMQWVEAAGKFTPPMLLWRPFVLEHGGYDEDFTQGFEDLELQMRLREHDLDARLLDSAIAFQHRTVNVRDLSEREFTDGLTAVHLNSKFPGCMPEVDDAETLLQNEKHMADAEAAVAEIALLEQADSNVMPEGAAELFAQICRYYFLHGVFEGLRDMGAVAHRRADSSTVAIYNHASHLENIAEYDEARRLFRLVLHRPDQQFWSRAEYHLGCIESALGNAGAAHTHFVECLKLDPAHGRARRALNTTALYREVSPNVFEIVGEPAGCRVLFVLFGGLADVINAFPVVAALKEKFPAEIVWLTSRKHAALARASAVHTVHEADARGIIPWDWVHAGGFTHVFCPEVHANREEWEASGLHRIDFMAYKCNVELEARRAWMELSGEAVAEAEEFLRLQGLKRGAFLTASHSAPGSRHWPHSNLMKLAHEVDMPTVVLGRKSDREIMGTISCFGRSHQVTAALIGWSSFYLGPASGISWIATTTDTPMGIFADPSSHGRPETGFRDILTGEKDDIAEWGVYTSPETVIRHLRSTILMEEPR